MEKQAHEWREECRVIVNKGRGKEDKYEAEVKFLRMEMAILSQGVKALRATSAVRSDSDVVLVAKCQKFEKKREEMRMSHRELEKQLGSVRRQLVAPEI